MLTCMWWLTYLSVPQNKLSRDYLRERGMTEAVSAAWCKLFCSQILHPDILKFGVENIAKFDSCFVVFQMLSASACSVKALVL